MGIKELEKELARLEAALLQTETIEEWDMLIHRYNALSLDRCRMVGESISYLSVNVTDKQLLNTRK